jgi:hypothetical protein
MIEFYIIGVLVALGFSEFGNYKGYTNDGRLPFYWNLFSWLWVMVCMVAYVYMNDKEE